MRARLFLAAGGVLLILLGLARGAGGVILLVQGVAADPHIEARGPAVVVVGVLLALIGLAVMIAGIGVLRRRRQYWILGLWGTVAFVIDGALNGAILFGRPGDRGTIVNVIAAALIVACLAAGRAALLDAPAIQTGRAPAGGRQR